MRWLLQFAVALAAVSECLATARRGRPSVVERFVARIALRDEFTIAALAVESSYVTINDQRIFAQFLSPYFFSDFSLTLK